MDHSNLVTSRDIGEAIRQRRKELGISQERLAEILGVSYQQVQRYENGSNKLNVENIQSVARALSVPVTYFLPIGYGQSVAETPPTYMSEDEKNLLKYFRKIKDVKIAQMVLEVARLAAKKS